MSLIPRKIIIPADYQYFPLVSHTMNKLLSKLLFVFLLSLQLPLGISAQELQPFVERCKALSQSSPIHNIWVDEENIKWVANSEGLHKVLGINMVQKVSIPGGTTNLLTIRGGNANIEWNTAEMNNLLGNVIISSASYDPKTKSLWIGTQDEGAFQVSVSPLRVMARFNMDNKKLTSNQINDIFIHNNGTIWIATDDGMLSGNGDKWTLQERYLNFVGVDAFGSNMWILGDDFLWQVDTKGKWSPIAIELKNVEGKLRDIAVDNKGRVWIASNMMTGFDVEANRYQRFGPGQYFTSQYVNCLDVDQDGSIWTGTDDKGLYLLQWESSLVVLIMMDTPLDCKTNQPTGALSVKVSGGEPPYTYIWSNGQTTDKIAQLAAGEYALTITDSKALVKSVKYTIPDPMISIAIEIIKPSSGSAEGDASANLLVNGGTGNMTYKWDNGESLQLASKLTGGTHAVTVTDASGCSATTSFLVPEKVIPLSVALTSVGETKCADALTGAIQADVKGGKAPIKYQWSNGSTAEGKLTGLAPKEYAVTVADAAGQTASAFLTLTAPPQLIPAMEMLSPANLGIANGQAQVKVTGGKAPYTYKWDSGATTALLKTLSSGEHTVTITDANGCTVTSTVNVSENIASLGVIVKQVGQINCSGQATGSLRTDISGGKGPYTYAWSNGQTTATAESLKAGPYTVTVTDVVGTKFTASSTVTEPQPVAIAISIDAPASTNGADGKATAKGSGGSGTFQYAWDNGELTAKAVKLPAGGHVVTVTDAAGCSSTANIVITENILALQVNIEQTATIKCNGTADASANVIVKGGKEPYTYAWSNGQTTTNVANLKVGSYTVTVTDVTGTTQTGSTVFAEPLPVTVATTIDGAASTNGSDGRATAKGSGGTGTFQYAWDNGELTAKAVKLPAGGHVVTVTDAAGCSSTANIVISENILALQVNIEQTATIKCNGTADASANVIVKGGKEPYTYAWSNGQTTTNVANLKVGSYTVTVTDVTGTTQTGSTVFAEPLPVTVATTIDGAASTNGSDGRATAKGSGGTGTFQYAWDNGELTSKAVKLPAGTHVVTVTDASGCSATGSVVITENILELQVTIEQTGNVKCASTTEGALKAIVTGGKGPYTYAWDNNLTTATPQNLTDGVYKLTVTDVAGQSATSVFSVFSPAPIVVTTKVEASATTNQKDGKASVVATGGTGKYTYAWDTGEKTAKAIALGAGSHTMTVTDENGCTAEGRFEITENILPLAVTIKQGDKILCADQATASLSAIATGGKSPYTYTWKGPGKEWSTETITQLAAGQYAMQVVDVTGSSATASIEVTAPKPLVLTAEEISPANTGNADGSVVLKASGGTGTYSIDGHVWSSNASSHKIEALKPGSYTYVVKDAAGCSAEVKVTITEDILPLSVTIKESTPIKCAGIASAGLDASVKGGKGPYTYAWSNGAGTASAANVAEGTITLSVTDVTGQKAQAEFKVGAPPKLTVDPTNLRSATNDRISDGKGSADAKGGTPPYTFAWSSGEVGAQATKLPLGKGNLIVTDRNGCTASAEFIIKEKVLPELTATRLASGEPIRMEKIQFDADSIVIKPEAVPSIDELYEFLYDNPTIIIEVSGHTNSLPADDYCDRISTERAKSVADYLIGKGIESRRVISIGHGKRKPIATNQTPEGRKKNQRVEIRLIKIEE